MEVSGGPRREAVVPQRLADDRGLERVVDQLMGSDVAMKVRTRVESGRMITYCPIPILINHMNP